MSEPLSTSLVPPAPASPTTSTASTASDSAASAAFAPSTKFAESAPPFVEVPKHVEVGPERNYSQSFYELNRHIAIKCVQTGAILGVVAAVPLHILRHCGSLPHTMSRTSLTFTVSLFVFFLSFLSF